MSAQKDFEGQQSLKFLQVAELRWANLQITQYMDACPDGFFIRTVNIFTFLGFEKNWKSFKGFTYFTFIIVIEVKMLAQFDL